MNKINNNNIIYYKKINNYKKKNNEKEKIIKIEETEEIEKNNEIEKIKKTEEIYKKELNNFKEYISQDKIDKFYKDICISVIKNILLYIEKIKKKNNIIDFDKKQYIKFISFIKKIKKEIINKISSNIFSNNLNINEGIVKNENNNNFNFIKYYDYITINNINYIDKYNKLVEIYAIALIRVFFINIKLLPNNNNKLNYSEIIKNFFELINFFNNIIYYKLCKI